VSVIDFFVFGLYLCLMIFIGYKSSKKIKNIEDFALGGKTIKPLIIVASSIATAAGAGTCLGQAGKAYTDGLSALWLVIAWFIGMLCLSLMAKKIYDTDAKSLSDIFDKLHGKSVSRLCSIYTMMYSLGMLIVQMIGMGTVLSLVLKNFGISYEIGVLIGGIITIVYTLQGGFFAVAYTDAAQMIVLAFSMIIVFPIIIATGIAEESLNVVFKVGTFNIFNNITFLGLIAVIFKYTFSACTGIPYIQRILASRNHKEAYKSQMFASFGYLILGSVIMIMAIFARLIYPSMANPDIVVVRTILEQFPNILAGLGIAALVAAVMSSVDSYLLVASQIFTQEICTWIFKDVSLKRELQICKLATVVFGALALLTALKFTQILVIYEFAATIYSSAIFFPFVLSLYCKKINKWGVVFGMLSGSIVALLSPIVLPNLELDSVIAGNFISLFMTVVVSLITNKPRNNMQLE